MKREVAKITPRGLSWDCDYNGPVADMNERLAYDEQVGGMATAVRMVGLSAAAILAVCIAVLAYNYMSDRIDQQLNGDPMEVVD